MRTKYPPLPTAIGNPPQRLFNVRVTLDVIVWGQDAQSAADTALDSITTDGKYGVFDDFVDADATMINP